MYKRMLKVFYDAISNEISIEKDILKRLDKINIGFTPLRTIKTIELIEKYNIGLFKYSLICLFFVFISPIYFFIKIVKNYAIIKIKETQTIKENVILVANGRVDYLYNKLNIHEKDTFININQNMKDNYISYKSLLKLSDYFKAYILSLISVCYLLYKLKDKTDILQVYVAYDWFLVYISLSRLNRNIKKVYFANHYDRWAVMFDQLFEEKEIVLIQHGILPDALKLDYQLKNINLIYSFDDKSMKLFREIYNLTKTEFAKLNLSLTLSDINSDRKTILIIGQPHSTNREVEIIKSLQNKYEVYVKPHPLYSNEIYKNIENVNIVYNKDFYPRVDLALCYESTLGLEYEASGIRVVWWKNFDIEQVSRYIETIFT